MSSKPLENLRVSPLSILGFALSGVLVLAPISLVLSLVAISEIKHNEDTLRGRGLARAGVVLSCLSFVWLGFCGVVYQHNMPLHRADMVSLEGVIRTNQASGEFRRAQENQADLERMRNNPPSFFNPFGL